MVRAKSFRPIPVISYVHASGPKSRATAKSVGKYVGHRTAAAFLANLHALVEMGLIELISDGGGELRCAVTELGVAVGGVEDINDDKEKS